MRLTSQNLNQLDQDVGSLHEADIFKICIKTLQKDQLSFILPSADLDHQKQIESCFRVFQKAWHAYSKYL